MLSLEEAQDAIIKSLYYCDEHESVPLLDAHNRFLAEDVSAQVDNPAFDNSAMDGYAVDTAQLIRAGFTLPLHGEASAGRAPGVLKSDSTMRIFTGAPVPTGADAVVIQEDIKIEGDKIIFPHTVQPGQNIRTSGQDFSRGQSLLEKGRRLSAPDLALLSAAGVPQLSVYRRPKIMVVATGDELVAPGQPLKPGQIYESNRLATLLQIKALGADAIDGGTVVDEPDAVRSMLKKAMQYDFVITSGGVSVGDHDLVKQVFAEIGKINFWKVRIKPGKPVAVGRLGDKTNFFGLPGNPVSSLVTFLLFVQPAIFAWHHSRTTPLYLTATATVAHRRRAGRTEFLRAKLMSDKGELKVEVLKGQGSHMMSTLKDSNCLVRVEHDCEGFEAGDAVTVWPLPSAFS
ncbi:MAG: gephyrin-like molybdotransferase Glp [Acidiferrobacterales bacterium]